MPRKSSFLMGFESGASTYDSAKRRQMAAKQLQLQTRQQTLAEDAAAQRAKYLDLQIKQAQATFERKQKQDVLDTDAYAAQSQLHDLLSATESDEQKFDLFRAVESTYLPKIIRSPKAYREYEVWRQDQIYDDETYKLSEERNNLGTQNKLAMVRAQNAEQKENVALMATVRKLEKLSGRHWKGDADNPGDVLEAHSMLTGRKVTAAYAAAGVRFNQGELDTDDDGSVTVEDMNEHLVRITELKKREALRLQQAGDVRALLLEQGKQKIKDASDAAKWLRENPDAASSNPETYNAMIENAVYSGQTPTELKAAMYPAGALRLINKKRNAVAAQISRGDLQGADLIKGSGVYSDRLDSTVAGKITKALMTQKQLKNIGDFLKKSEIDTGPIEGKISDLKVMRGTDEGKDISKLTGMLNAIIPGLARGIYGEVGVLTEADVELYKGTFMSLRNDEEVNDFLFKVTSDLVKSAITTSLEVYAMNGKNVSGFLQSYIDVGGESSDALGGGAGAYNNMPPEMKEQFDKLPEGSGTISETNYDNLINVEGRDYPSEDAAQQAVNLMASATGKRGTVVVRIDGVNNRLSIPQLDKLKDWQKAFDTKLEEEGKVPFSRRHRWDGDAYVPAINSRFTAPVHDIDEAMPSVDEAPGVKPKVPSPFPPMLETTGGKFIPADSIKPAPQESPLDPNKAFIEARELEEAQNRAMEAAVTKASGEPAEGPKPEPKGIEGEVPGEVPEGEIPPLPTDEVPGTLSPTPKVAGEMQRRKDARETRKKKLEGKPADSPTQRRKDARGRRLLLLQMKELKPIIDELGNSPLDTGEGVIQIQATDEAGVLITKDGKDELMTWDDFEELMDKLGYLK